MTENLLLEIGTEELPSGFIAPALGFMKAYMEQAFSEINLGPDRIDTFGTPRRLALMVTGVPSFLEDTIETKMGPPKKIAFDDKGKPTKAGAGFAKTMGVEISEISIEKTPRGEYLCLSRTIPGKKTSETLPGILNDLVRTITFPKTMRWSAPDMRFARPVHWICCLLGEEILPVSFGDCHADRFTFGHRFMSPDTIGITKAANYEATLEAHYVIPDITKRKTMIEKGMNQLALECSAETRDPDLLDEVVNLVEFPYIIKGSFDDAFLKLPAEVLVTVMKHHQRFFPMYKKDSNDLIPSFLSIINIEPRDETLVRMGNERVLRARLDDARYFFDADMKIPMVEYAQRMKDVIFHKDLGSSLEKVERFTHIALYLTQYLAPDKKDKVREAATLSKADLNSLMVNELPELQGIMGREYALAQGHDPEVCQAIYEHYLPVTAADRLPSAIIGDLVGIADRIDTICGCFCVGMIPTGASDPYALRRQTFAIENIILGKGYRISIRDLVDEALSLLSSKMTRPGPEVRTDVLNFFESRLVSILQNKGLSWDVIEAVRRDWDDPLDTFMRAKALFAIHDEPWLASITAASKRVENILKKTSPGKEVHEDLFQEKAESMLYAKLLEVEDPFIRYSGKGEYASALRLLVKLKKPIDTFFDEVLVMSEDPSLRANRTSLLNRLVNLFGRIAQFAALS